MKRHGRRFQMLIDLQSWLGFTLASAALLAVPGPVIIFTINETLGRGKQAAMPLVIGAATGDVVAIAAALFGVGALLVAEPAIYSTAKIGGAAYLIYLGITGIIRSARPITGILGAPPVATSVHLFRHGFILTALHPAGIVFFVSFVPGFLNEGAPILPQIAALTLTFGALATINLLAWAFLADRSRDLLSSEGILRTLRCAGSVVLVALGIGIIL